MKRRNHRRLGNLRAVKFIQQDKVTWDEKKVRGAKRTGQLYEQKVLKYLEDVYEGQVLPSQWIVYEEVGLHAKYAQPDILVFDPWKGIIYLIECKLTHTTEAYWQMNNKYVPLLEYLFPNWQIARVEVYKNMSGFKWPNLTEVVDGLDMIKGNGDYMWRLNV